MEPQPLNRASISSDAFGDALNSDGARQVAARAIDWATIDLRAGEIVIDRRAMLQALFEHGSPGGSNAAGWLIDALVDQGVSPAIFQTKRSQPQGIDQAIRDGRRVILSVSVRGELLPTARGIAQLTMRRERIDLRHLAMALLAPPGEEWSPLEDKIDFVALRQAIVDRLELKRERGESIEGWRSLIDRRAWRSLIDRNPAAPPQGAASDNAPRSSDEALPVHTDDPATIDQLGREGFARVLTTRVIQARERAAADAAAAARDDDDNRAFIVHIHGPWGSGKSTLLNFMRRELETMRPAWLVVEFNAWRSQRLKPPWWSVITQVKRAAIRNRPDMASRLVLRLHWRLLRARADLVPAAIGAVLIGGALLLGVATSFGAGQPFQWLTTAITALVGVFAFSRSLVFGSASIAQSFAELRSDPYGPMITLFARLVRAVDKPIVMFIDDLDRCESAYVCDLLENIQTMLRAAPITYIIAADRKWICTSFEKRYADFAAGDVDSGRPLGYQFLDKLFQISATLPILSPTTRAAFWEGLLKAGRTGGGVAEAEALADQARTITTAKTVVEVQDLIAGHADEPALQQAIRAELAIKLSSPEESEATEHRLRALATLVDSNPRSMKRLANAVGMNQARMALEARQDLTLEAIARWTILEVRWPLLADWLSADPARVATPSATDAGAGDRAMQALLARSDVANVIGAAGAAGRLDEATLRSLVG